MGGGTNWQRDLDSESISLEKCVLGTNHSKRRTKKRNSKVEEGWISGYRPETDEEINIKADSLRDY